MNEGFFELGEVSLVEIEGEVNVGRFWFIMHDVAACFSTVLKMHLVIRDTETWANRNAENARHDNR